MSKFFQSTWFLIICCQNKLTEYNLFVSELWRSWRADYYVTFVIHRILLNAHYVLTGAAQHKARHHQCLTIMWHLQRNICRQTEDEAANLFWLRDFWWDAECSSSRCWLHHIFISSLTSFLFFMSLMPAESRPGCYLIERKKKKSVPLPVHGLLFITTSQTAVMHRPHLFA